MTLIILAAFFAAYLAACALAWALVRGGTRKPTPKIHTTHARGTK